MTIDIKKSITIVLLIACAVFPFVQNISDPFVSDDWNFLYVVSQEEVTVGSLLMTNTQGEFGPGTYRPMVNVFWYTMHELFGLVPFPYHIATLGFHVLNAILIVVLVYTLASLVSKKTSFSVAALAGFLFAIFPNHSASVAWVSVINDTMMTTFYLAGLVLVTKAAMNWRHRHVYLSLALVCCVLALFTKEMAITFPLVATLCVGFVWYYKKDTRYDVVKVVYALIPFFLLVGVYFLLRMQVTGFFAEDYANNSISFSFGKLSQTALGTFVGHFFTDRIRAFVVGAVLEFSFVVLLLIGGIGASFIAKNLQEKKVSLGWLAWVSYVVSLIPVAHFGLGYSTAYISEEGERFSYLPSAFVAFGLSLCFFYIYTEAKKIRKTRSAAVLITGVLLACIMLVGLYQKNTRWHVAAEVGDTLLNQAAEVLERESFDGAVFVGMPDNLHGAFIYRNAFDLALQTKYGVPKEQILVSANRVLVDQQGVTGVERLDEQTFIYTAQQGTFIADLPERNLFDYQTRLEENLLDPNSRSHGSLGNVLQFQFSDSFMNMNQDKRIGLFFFVNGEWQVYEL